MAKNEGSSSSSLRPTITLPPRTAVESLFAVGGTGASPGPMSLVSSFFCENDPESDCRSFSQLLAGAMSSPEKKGSGGGEDVDFRLKHKRPAGMTVAQQSPMFTVPPGLSPAYLLNSPAWFPPGQGQSGLSQQQTLAQVSTHANSQIQNPPDFSSALTVTAPLSLPQLAPPSTSGMATAHQQPPPPSLLGHGAINEPLDPFQSETRAQHSSLVVDKPVEDGYNWRKYGQKQVKGSEFPRSYYKCTHPKCPVKKKVERSHDGQVTEIIYKGQHNHQPPQPSKRGNLNGISNTRDSFELSGEGMTGNFNRMIDNETGLANPESLPGSSDSEDEGYGEIKDDDRAEDEPDAKRRSTEVRATEPTLSHKTVTEPRIIVQTTSEVDLLDDGYRWRKYGQKVVKGNPYPRSYYKCTSQGCNVRKHVERAASDPKAVITTYEGKHNHDVPAARSSSHNTAPINNASQLRPQHEIPETTILW